MIRESKRENEIKYSYLLVHSSNVFKGLKLGSQEFSPGLPYGWQELSLPGSALAGSCSQEPSGTLNPGTLTWDMGALTDGVLTARLNAYP